MRGALIVGAGGFLGTVCRYWFSMIPLPHRADFPVATLAINALGALLLGALAGLSERLGNGNAQWMAFLRVGLCGGFTTFSTFALEAAELIRGGRAWAAAAYMALSLALGLAAIWAGRALAA
ncbi:MAG: fluoride efflux transporter CrcB [Clostridiales bacterium]|nr:fluoride efflux transporter CrcB [Clostridiales bacterium]